MLRELRKGTASLLLLDLLSARPMYGFELAEALRQRTNGVLTFKEGTLYPALHRLEAEGLVKPFWQDSPRGPRRRYYLPDRAGPQGAGRTPRALAHTGGGYQWRA